jgi:hypothetical protein
MKPKPLDVADAFLSELKTVTKALKRAAAKRIKPKRVPATTDAFARSKGYAPIERFYPTKREAKNMTTSEYVEAFCKDNHYAV